MLVQHPSNRPSRTFDGVVDVADRKLLTAIHFCGACHLLGGFRERPDDCALANHRQALVQRRRMREHHCTFLVPAESQDRLEGLILPHVLEERVGRLAAVLKVTALPRALDGLAGEGGPLLDDGIPEVPTAEDGPELQNSLSECW